MQPTYRSNSFELMKTFKNLGKIFSLKFFTNYLCETFSQVRMWSFITVHLLIQFFKNANLQFHEKKLRNFFPTQILR